MATEGQPAVVEPQESRGGGANRPRQNRRRGRAEGEQRAEGSVTGQGRENENSRRGRNEGRRRGEGRKQRDPASRQVPSQDNEGATSDSGGAHPRFMPTMQASNSNDETEGEVCFICASPVIHNSISSCNHLTCHVCALRLRALYKTRTCAHCRTDVEHMIFTDNPSRKYETFEDDDFAEIDDVLGIKYENPQIFQDTMLVLRFNCPDPTCDIACLSWPDLFHHVRSAHHKIMCDLCTRNKKVFTHEHELFTPAELRKHEKSGDDNPGAADQSGFKGHPACGFCRRRFYSDNELYTHCRDKHERCHICDRRNERRQQQYYANYDSLEVHFGKDHFLCPDKECLDKKFVVFDSEIDLKAHQLEAHPNGLTKDARREARRVDLSSFDFRSHDQDSNRNGNNRREGRGRGRGRDPNTDSVPTSSAQSFRRDEVAYQRQMAIQSAQSISTRTFGGQLTSSNETYAARPSSANASRGATGPNTTAALPPASGVQGDVDTTSQMDYLSFLDSNPQNQARALQHASVTSRASNLFQNSTEKMDRFRGLVSSYRQSSVSAPSFIDSILSLVPSSSNTPSAETGTLVRELAELYDDGEKQTNLIKAWNDRRALRDDYPALPNENPSGSILGGGGARVLKLKRATAPASQEAFPAIGAPGRSNSKPSPAWASTITPNSNPPSPSPRATTPNPVSRSPAPVRDAFPALPSAGPSKPSINTYASGAPVQRNASSLRGMAAPPSQAAWGASSSANESAFPALGQEQDQGQTKKGKAVKKQTLFHFG